MANWDYRRVASWGTDSVTLEDGEVMRVYVVPDGSPGGFRLHLRGNDLPVWQKVEKAKAEAAKKAKKAESEALLTSMLDGSHGAQS